jgi:hypothetical protein
LTGGHESAIDMTLISALANVLTHRGADRLPAFRGTASRSCGRARWALRLGLIALGLALLPAASFMAVAKDVVPIPRISPKTGGELAPDASGGGAMLPGDDDFPADATGDAASGEGDIGDTGLDPAATGAAPPAGSPAAAPAPVASGAAGSFALEAHLTADSPPIAAGLTWRVFDSDPNPDGKLKLIGEAHGGSVRLTLKPGVYFVHVAYGRAGATKKVTVDGRIPGDSVVLNAGGLRLLALVGHDQPLNASDVNFDIYAPDEDGSDERILLVANAPASEVIGLNAGTYHVVCRYGDANAVVRADIRVEAGKLTEAAVYQKAARLTLKLVEEHGGEALADTSWSVMTASGESVVDSVGAFPTVVLAAGDYTAIARHDGKTFERTFAVESGLNRDVEVLANESSAPPATPPETPPADGANEPLDPQ